MLTEGYLSSDIFFLIFLLFLEARGGSADLKLARLKSLTLFTLLALPSYLKTLFFSLIINMVHDYCSLMLLVNCSYNVRLYRLCDWMYRVWLCKRFFFLSMMIQIYEIKAKCLYKCDNFSITLFTYSLLWLTNNLYKLCFE